MSPSWLVVYIHIFRVAPPNNSVFDLSCRQVLFCDAIYTYPRGLVASFRNVR